MSPANDPLSASVSLDATARHLVEIADAHSEWFMSEDGRVPLEIKRSEFDFSAAHGRLLFSSWTQQGSRTWRVNEWTRTDDKLVLRTSRRMGAESATIELVPRASAKALVATIAAARQQRCECLAQLVAEGVGGRVLGVEGNDLSPKGKFKSGQRPTQSNRLNTKGVGGRVLGVEANDLSHDSQFKSSQEPTQSNLNTKDVGRRVLGVETNGLSPESELKPQQAAESDRLKLKGVGGRVLGVKANDLSRKSELRPAQAPAQSNQLHPKPYTQHPSLKPSVKIERAALSPGMRRDQPGRYAQIILRSPLERIAVTGTVAESDPRNVDSLFSSALLWFARIQSAPKRPPINRLLIVVEKDLLEAARQRHVLLRGQLRERIELWQLGDDWQAAEPTPPWERRYLWRKRLPTFPSVMDMSATDRVNEIVGLNSEAIDVVASRHGHTLRYHGLPFARVRRVMEREHVWFGIEGSPRRLLGAYQHREFAKLLADLQAYRNQDCRDRRHWYYRAAGEAWLESILRRDISRLDPGLIVAPLHAQFRTSRGGPTGQRPIDLLALRHDGRLAVIELKVNEDREHVFQGVDYWRRVEAHRRRGHISSAKLFGDREISDESPLVYLVAPTLRFHPSFTTLARTIAPDIEIYKFDINENWRAGVRVVRRERLNA